MVCGSLLQRALKLCFKEGCDNEARRNTAKITFIRQEVTILLTNQHSAVFLAPPSRVRLVCLAPQQKFLRTCPGFSLRKQHKMRTIPRVTKLSCL